MEQEELDETVSTLSESTEEVLPLMSETIWLSQNKYEEAESFYHQKLTGTLDGNGEQRSTCSSRETQRTELSHPLLAETIWLQQKFYEDSEADFRKAQAQASPLSPEVKQTKTKKKEKKKSEIEVKNSATEKIEPSKWIEKLQKRLIQVEEKSQQLEGLMDNLAKAQTRTQSLAELVSSTIETCLKPLVDGIAEDKARVDDVQTIFPSVKSTIRKIKKSMNVKDCKSYVNHERYCQSMHDRLLEVEKWMNHWESRCSSAPNKSVEQALQHIITNLKQVTPENNMQYMMEPSGKVILSVELLNKILKDNKGQKNNTTKVHKTSGNQSSANYMPIESHEELSSLSGECSDFGPDMEDFENETLSSKSGEKNENKAPSQVKPTTQKKPKKSIKKKTAEPSSQVQANKSPKGTEQKAKSSKKAPKKNNETNQLQRNKSKTFHNSSMNSTSYSGKTVSVTPQLFASSMVTPSSVCPDYNQMNPAFITSNPVLLEQQLNEMAQKLQSMHLVAKHTLELQQMMRETERLRQMAFKAEQQSLLQEQFRQRYETLLNSFGQYQNVYAQQQVQAGLPKHKEQSAKAQPSARFSSMQKMPQPGPNTKDLRRQQVDLSQTVSRLPGAVNASVQPSETLRQGKPLYQASISRVAHLGSFSPGIHMDNQKAGISSMVVFDSIDCLVMVDIINSCLKLFKFTFNNGLGTYSFNFVTTLNLPSPYYMARLGNNEVAVSRNNSLISVVLVSSRELRLVNQLEMSTQYYGLAFVVNNTVAAAAYEAKRIDLLKIHSSGTLGRVSCLAHVSYGPELLAKVPATNDIVYLEKHPNNRLFLRCINLKGEEVFKTGLGSSPINVWNLSCIGDTILCCDKHRNKLQFFSSSGRKQGLLSWSDMPVDQPFALCFSLSGNLFLANDGAWEMAGNHYVTTEINVFSFPNKGAGDFPQA